MPLAVGVTSSALFRFCVKCRCAEIKRYIKDSARGPGSIPTTRSGVMFSSLHPRSSSSPEKVGFPAVRFGWSADGVSARLKASL